MQLEVTRQGQMPL